MNEQKAVRFDVNPIPANVSVDDGETIGHVERVCAYTGILARQLVSHPRFSSRLDDLYIQRLSLAAALHDVGKASLPPEILSKPSALTARESRLVRRHTLLGAGAIDTLLYDHPDPALRELASEVALTHHERWDGKGYPRGLAGEMIPVSGRIVALADVYDALTSKRAYKDAFTHESATAVIVRDSGAHFDPAVVEAFLDVQHEMVRAAAVHAAGQQVAHAA